jgi:hypothetical protein
VSITGKKVLNDLDTNGTLANSSEKCDVLEATAVTTITCGRKNREDERRLPPVTARTRTGVGIRIVQRTHNAVFLV